MKTDKERKDEQAGVLLMIIVCIAVWSALLILIDSQLFK